MRQSQACAVTAYGHVVEHVALRYKYHWRQHTMLAACAHLDRLCLGMQVVLRLHNRLHQARTKGQHAHQQDPQQRGLRFRGWRLAEVEQHLCGTAKHSQLCCIGALHLCRFIIVEGALLSPLLLSLVPAALQQMYRHPHKLAVHLLRPAMLGARAQQGCNRARRQALQAAGHPVAAVCGEVHQAAKGRLPHLLAGLPSLHRA